MRFMHNWETYGAKEWSNLCPSPSFDVCMMVIRSDWYYSSSCRWFLLCAKCTSRASDAWSQVFFLVAFNIYGWISKNQCVHWQESKHWCINYIWVLAVLLLQDYEGVFWLIFLNFIFRKSIIRCTSTANNWLKQHDWYKLAVMVNFIIPFHQAKSFY